jgi:tetratricopeptide (TPR) repeat protein
MGLGAARRPSGDQQHVTPLRVPDHPWRVPDHPWLGGSRRSGRLRGRAQFGLTTWANTGLLSHTNPGPATPWPNSDGDRTGSFRFLIGALGDESACTEAMRAYQELLAEHPDDAGLHWEYGRLPDAHGRNSIRAAVACFERAIELDPGQNGPRSNLIFSRAALHETELAVDLYKKRLAAAPDQIREYGFLARALFTCVAFPAAGVQSLGGAWWT